MLRICIWWLLIHIYIAVDCEHTQSYRVKEQSWPCSFRQWLYRVTSHWLDNEVVNLEQFHGFHGNLMSIYTHYIHIAWWQLM